MTPDRPYLGILLMLGFCVMAPMGDAIAKYLGSAIPLGMLLLVRFAIQPVVLVPISLTAPGGLAMSARTLRLTLIRTVLHIGAIAAMFTSLLYLPLADAVAIAFVMPFILLMLGHLILGEEVGRHRIGACIAGFAGTLMVVQPNFVEVGLPALLPLVVAVLFAVFMLITRQIAKEVDAVRLQAVSGLMATAILLPLVLIGPDWPAFALIRPTAWEAWLLIALGLFGTVAHLMMTWSLRFAPSATLAPMQYLEIPVATLVGWLVFRDLPNGLAALGICLTIAAGLYIILRERAIARTPSPAAP